MNYSASAQFSLPKEQAADGEGLGDLKSKFIQNISHELRTPLQIVQGYASLLRDGDLGALAPEQEEAIGVIASRADELRTLVERIGILLAIESDLTVQRTVKVDGIVEEVVDAYVPIASESEVDLQLALEEAAPSVLGDPYHLEQVVECLVENAIKFTPEGGKVWVTVEADPAWVSIAVSDTGIGIEESELERIFSGFYQVDGSTTRRYGGLGLGLTVVRAVVEEHQGQIQVTSQPGEGSCFIVNLPVKADDEVEQVVEGESILQRVLIVDDEEFVALTLSEALSSLPNCEVSAATDAAKALELFEEQPFDLLITDYKMPETNGIDLAAKIRDLYPQTVVIMVTAYGDDMLREQATESSIQRIMDKPVRLADIRKVTLEALGRFERSDSDKASG